MKNDLVNYTIHLADNTLILAQRNSEWCGHGPVLEQDIAITNISLDLLGQARLFYQYAAVLINQDDPDAAVTEDDLAYLRDARAFKNCLIAEQPNGDWAATILRQFLFSAYQFYLYEQMNHCADTQLAAIAEKSLKEVTYHLRWSSEWVIRLGDGTKESTGRMNQAIDNLWMYTGEFFMPATYERNLVDFGIVADTQLLQLKWEEKVKTVFEEAGLKTPLNVFQQVGGKEGKHTEYLGFVLAELQFLQRAYPGSEW